MGEFHEQRAGILQAMPRGLASANSAQPRSRAAPSTRAGARPGPYGPAALDEAVVQALDALRRDGGAGLDNWLDGSGMDALERHNLLRQAQLRAEGTDHGPLQHALDRLLQQDGAAIEQGMLQQELLQATLHELQRTADDAPRRGALAQLEQQLLGTRAGAPIEAHTLGSVLAEACSEGQFCTVLAALRRQRARAPQSRLANSGAQVWLSLKDAASLNLLQSCYAIGAHLHANLANASLLAPSHGPGHDGAARAAVALLALSTDSPPGAAALAQAAGASTDASGQGRVEHLLMGAVRELPLSLWPQSHARGALLAELRAGAGAHAAMPLAHRAPDDKRVEDGLRRAHRISTTTFKEQ